MQKNTHNFTLLSYLQSASLSTVREHKCVLTNIALVPRPRNWEAA